MSKVSTEIVILFLDNAVFNSVVVLLLMSSDSL